MRLIVNLEDWRSMDEAYEKLRVAECGLPSLGYLRETHVKCLSCGESKKFYATQTAYDFCERHRRRGCKKVEVLLLGKTGAR